MKEKCAVVACMMAACCLSGVLCACAQDGSNDLKVADLESRINVERDAVSDLRQREVRAQREKSLLALEIEQELGRISKLNREIKPASERAQTRASRKSPAPVAHASSAPSAVSVKQEPDLSASQSGALDIDAESQAEIDKLVAMREKLIAERDSLEQLVKPAPGAP